MQTYWFNNTIDDGGIYVATRGITNSWKLHWENNSFACYDRIIENCILLNDVDPNRVYLMGYSAGGDGVYRVTPVMADRFAAVNMCAGHPNGVSVTNYMHVPTLLQVGECDTAYNRHKIAVQYNQSLQQRRKACGGDGYVSECRVHSRAGHSYIKDRGDVTAPIIANNSTWISGGARPGACSDKSIAGNSIRWLHQYTRDPIPFHIIFEPNQTSRPSPRGVDLSKVHHYLDLTIVSGRYDAKVIEVSYLSNTIVIHKMGSALRILLDDRMIDMGRPVQVQVSAGARDGTSKECTRSITFGGPSRKTMNRTLSQRCDPEYIFTNSIDVDLSDATKCSIVDSSEF